MQLRGWLILGLKWSSTVRKKEKQMAVNTAQTAVIQRTKWRIKGFNLHCRRFSCWEKGGQKGNRQADPGWRQAKGNTLCTSVAHKKEKESSQQNTWAQVLPRGCWPAGGWMAAKLLAGATLPRPAGEEGEGGNTHMHTLSLFKSQWACIFFPNTHVVTVFRHLSLDCHSPAR